MIPIILSNGTTIEVENESSKTDFVVRVDSFTELDSWKQVITEENINDAVMEGETLVNLVFTSIATSLEDVCIRADFYFREKSDVEILQEEVKALEEKKPALTSAFTDNAEPTGTAERYYEKGEILAIYDKNDIPTTVKVTMPIGYGQSIVIGLNCEKYYGE